MIINRNIQELSNLVLKLIIMFLLWPQIINTLRLAKEFVIPSEC